MIYSSKNTLDVSAVLGEQRRRWENGERVYLEALLPGEPHLEVDGEALLKLIYQEIALREESGETPGCEEYVERFPAHAKELRVLLRMHQALVPSEAEPMSTEVESSGTGLAGKRAKSGVWEGQNISHYRPGKRLGAGGMGEVYLAEDLALGRPVALKVLPEDFTPSLRDRLLREAWASARLQHPAIATFYEAGEHEGLAFIAMEHVEGETLRERLKRGPLAANDALAVTACLLEALAHAHAAGVLHRDIKPENIMILGERTAKLLDFGLAKSWEGEPLGEVPPAEVEQPPERGEGLSLDVTGASALEGGGGLPETPKDLTAAGLLIGTFGYMAPEQARGKALDQRADLFVIGAVLYEMLTGQRAFPGETRRKRVLELLQAEPPRLPGGKFPEGLEAVLRRALAREPEERYPTAGAFLRDLRRVAEKAVTRTVADTAAVLDFQVLSQLGEDDWLGCRDGRRVARRPEPTAADPFAAASPGDV